MRTRPHGLGPASELLTSRVCWVDARQVDLHHTRRRPGGVHGDQSLARACLPLRKHAQWTAQSILQRCGGHPRAVPAAASVQKAEAGAADGDAWSHVLAEADTLQQYVRTHRRSGRFGADRRVCLRRAVNGNVTFMCTSTETKQVLLVHRKLAKTDGRGRDRI